MSFLNLTSVRQDPVEMGAAAVDAAIRMMSDPRTETQEQLIIPSLVARGSTGPARS
jgi:DNA-binding LacI/PurR family transcriptional regulator